MTRRRLASLAGAATVVATPVTLALTDGHLAQGPTSLVVSTAAAALAVSALALQPLLARAGRIRPHQVLGTVALVLVLVHIGALAIVSIDDTLFAMSPDGPTRARMALFGTIALILTVALGAGRRRLPIRRATWRILHAYLGVLVIVLGVGHALLTDGALDDTGTVVLLVLGGGALAGIAAAHARRRGTARAPAGATRHRPSPADSEVS